MHVTGSRLEQLWQMLFLQKPDVGTGLAGRLRSPPSDRRSRGPALLPAVPRRSGPASATSRSSRRWGQEPRGRCAEPAFLVERFRKPPHTHTHTHHDFVRRLSRGQESCHRVAVSQGEGSWGLRLGTHDKARNILRGSGGESAGGAGPGTAGSGSESGTVTITASLIFKTFVRTNASHAVKSAAGGVRRVRGPREASRTTRSAPHARTCVCPGRLPSQALPVSPWRLPPAASSRLQSLRAPRGTPAPVAGRRR